MTDIESKPATAGPARPGTGGAPGSASEPHPTDAIPLPPHGFANLDDLSAPDPESADPGEIVTRASLLLITAAAEQLGLSPDSEPVIDLDGSRDLITALSGLLAASTEFLGEHREPLLDAVATLRGAFREASAYPDAPGAGPGETLLP